MLDALDAELEGVVGLALADLLRLRLAKVVKITDPAAGAELAITVPGGVTWELLSFTALLTPSAVVATRIPSLRYRDELGNTLAGFAAATTQAASAAARHTFAQGIGDHNTVGMSVAALPTPPLPLIAGSVIATVTSNLDVGDAWSAGFAIVREWQLDNVRLQSEWIGRHYR